MVDVVVLWQDTKQAVVRVGGYNKNWKDIEPVLQEFNFPAFEVKGDFSDFEGQTPREVAKHLQSEIEKLKS